MWYEIGMVEHDFICQSCGRRATQGHHYFFKGTYPHLKYDTDNCVPLCLSCHSKLHFKDPKGAEKDIIKTKGIKWLKALEKKAFIIPIPRTPRTLSYIQNIYDKLIKQL